MATRIKARAGELLKQIEPGHGANQNIKAGDRPKVRTRSDAACEAGLSPHQSKQAQRLANLPEEEFEKAVESPKPPTRASLRSRAPCRARIISRGG